jgi:hypothetical protein
MASLDFHRDGAQLFKGAATRCLNQILAGIEQPTN